MHAWPSFVGHLWYPCRISAAEEARKVLEGSSYRLKLLPSKSITLQLLFTARVEASYDFPLLIQLMGYGIIEKGIH